MSFLLDKNSKIAVLAGGISEEREISLRSAANVFAALQRLGYQNAFLFELALNKTHESLGQSLKELIDLKSNGQIDAAVLMTHGTYGEDGRLQGFLDLLNIPYSGSSARSSANCMNKFITKEILLANALPCLESLDLLELASSGEVLVEGFEDEMDPELPYIFKPREEGSSVGIQKFPNAAALRNFIINKPDLKLESFIAEPFVKGIELTASIIPQDSILNVLPLLEIRPKNEFYDYEAKYTEGMTQFILPAEIPEAATQVIQELAMAAYEVMDCSGPARVDFILEKLADDEYAPYILELNTLPGMTNTSDLPAQAKQVGIGYDELVELILKSI